MHSNRNLVLFAAIVSLQYLSAPVIYVGITQASLLKGLGANSVVSGLPTASFFVMATLVAFVAWLLPGVKHLKPVLATCYFLAAVSAFLAAAVLAAPVSATVKILVVILQGAITGATIPTAIAFLWEVLGRTTDPAKRGVALGLAYGGGPVFAALGSLASQLILAGHFELGPLVLQATTMQLPMNFALLFALIAPAMGAAAFLSLQFEVELPREEPARKPFREIADLMSGIAAGVAGLGAALCGWMPVSVIMMFVSCGCFIVHFRDLLSNQLLRRIAIMTLIFYLGNTISSNMNLYSKFALGAEPAEYSGYQNLLRFIFKALAGTALGWLLVRRNPRSGVLVTGTLYLLALLWAMNVDGKWYLIAFGIFGAGELIGVYAPNYMLTACRPDQMKRGQVMMNLAMGPAGQSAVIFGWIADGVHESGMAFLDIAANTDSAHQLGFQISFGFCAAIIVVGLIYTGLMLPKDPKRPMDAR